MILTEIDRGHCYGREHQGESLALMIGRSPASYSTPTRRPEKACERWLTVESLWSRRAHQ